MPHACSVPLDHLTLQHRRNRAQRSSSRQLRQSRKVVALCLAHHLAVQHDEAAVVQLMHALRQRAFAAQLLVVAAGQGWRRVSALKQLFLHTCRPCCKLAAPLNPRCKAPAFPGKQKRQTWADFGVLQNTINSSINTHRRRHPRLTSSWPASDCPGRPAGEARWGCCWSGRAQPA